MTAEVPDSASAPVSEPVLFDAVLYPHRSLPPGAFWIVMGGVAGLSFSAGLVFTLLGAWPVLGFFGLDVLLLGWFFHLNYRQGRLHETVRLTPRQLTVQRVHPDGAARSWKFQPFWVRVELDDPPHRLSLASHGRRLAIGAFLSAEEKRSFAAELRRALTRLRTPTGLPS